MKKLLPILFVICFGCKKSPAPPPVVTYTITATSEGNGSISQSGAHSVLSGTDQYYDMTPNAGYALEALTVDGNSVKNTNPYVFKNVISNHTIVAKFGVPFKITTIAAPNGLIECSDSMAFTGDSVVVTFYGNDSYHADSLFIDGQFIKIVDGAYSYTLTNVTRSHTVMVTFSNSIPQSVRDSLNTILLNSKNGTWHYTYVESRVDGGVFDWQELTQFYPCIKDDYLQFMPGFQYLWSINGTACGFGWKVVDDVGTYKFTLNGKGVILYHGSRIDTLAINKLTSDSLIVTSRAAYQAQTSIKYVCVPGK